MGLGYQLINFDKKERISFDNINCGLKKKELSGTIVSSSIVTYYLLSNVGNCISFVDDHASEFQLFGNTYSWDEFNNYTEVTNKVVQSLLEDQILQNKGKFWIDKEEGLFYYDLENVWDPKIKTQADKKDSRL